MDALKKKLKNKKGESIAEVMVGMLISVLGLVLLATAISAATNMVIKSKTKMANYIREENKLAGESTEEGAEGALQITDSIGTTVITLYDSAPASYTVRYAENEEANATPVRAFWRK